VDVLSTVDRGSPAGLDLVNWCMLLPTGPDARVLQVGEAPDLLTHGLAAFYRQVVVLQMSPEHSSSSSRRGKALPRNVCVVQADPGGIPLRPESVDLAVLVGPLPPRGADQLALLRSVWGVLKTEGLIYLGVHNRWATATRTWLERLRSRSARGYRALLVEAGFIDVRVWCALPSHGEPRYLVPLEQRAFGHFLRVLVGPAATPMKRVATWALHGAGALKHLVPSFVLVARHGGSAGAG
jgi:SAM-dependent methyltransferase